MVLSPVRRALRRPRAGPGFGSQSLHCSVWELVGFSLCLSFPIDGALFIRSGMAGCRPRPDTLLASRARNVCPESQSGPACPPTEGQRSEPGRAHAALHAGSKELIPRLLLSSPTHPFHLGQ